MSDVIEVMARALCLSAGFDDPDEMVSTDLGAQGTINHGIAWTLFEQQAERALSALTAAGYAVVPVEPTPEMTKVAMETIWSLDLDNRATVDVGHWHWAVRNESNSDFRHADARTGPLALCSAALRARDA